MSCAISLFVLFQNIPPCWKDLKKMGMMESKYQNVAKNIKTNLS